VKIKIILFAVYIITFACKKHPPIDEEIMMQNKQLILNKYHTNGKIKEKSYLNEDSVKEGLSVVYDDQGNILLELYYNNGKKDSIETEYYISGELKSHKLWNLGKLWGEYVTYYDGLKDIYFTEISNDTFRIEEPLRKSYSYYDQNERIAYQRTYDTLGNLIEQKGNGIIATRVFHPKIDQNDTLHIQYYVANPPWVSKDFFFEIFDETGLIKTEKQEIDKKFSAVFYKNVFDKPGIYNIRGILTLKDELNENLKKDTINVKIIVGLDEDAI